MALSAEEQAQLDALLTKQTAPEPEKPKNPFTDIFDVISYLVHHSTAFSGNEELRQLAKDTIEVAAGRTEKKDATNESE